MSKTAKQKTRRPIENAELKAATGDGPGWIEGYGAVFGNVDQGLDRILPGAFAKTIQERIKAGKVPLMASHWGEAEEVIGTVTQAREDSRGLWFHADLASTDEAQKIRTLVSEGHLKGLSIGYVTIACDYSTEEGREIRNLKEVAVYEITTTPFPMNEEAGITQSKTAQDGALDARLARIEKALGISQPETTSQDQAAGKTTDWHEAGISDLEREIEQTSTFIEIMKAGL